MPELPEVETIKEILKNQIINKTISNIEIFRNQTIVGNCNDFKESLEGETITDITRKGKFLVFHLTNNKVFLSHLRMEGKYYFYLNQNSHSQFERVRFNFNDGTLLIYDDSRMFGIMELKSETTYLNENPIAKLGPEPFNISDLSLIKAKFNLNVPVKSHIMDQSVIAGLGNIYADEVLFLSKIHPLTPAKYLSDNDIYNIVENSKNVLTKAINAGGSTIKSYHPSEGSDGRFQRELLAYGKENQPCPNCSTKMKRIAIGGRSSTFCPRCQKRLDVPTTIAITGPIGSGKSLVTRYLNKKGFTVLSCDEIVHNLYNQKAIQDKIIKILNINSFDKTIIKQKMLDNSNKKLVENIVHPLVWKTIQKELKLHDVCDFVFVEVPLLFESGFDKFFTFTTYVDVNEDVQKRNLEHRKSNVEYSLKLNKTFDAKKDKKLSDFVLDNSKDKQYLFDQIENLLVKICRS